jgi:hypothetical protein
MKNLVPRALVAALSLGAEAWRTSSTFALPVSRLAFIGVDNKPVVERRDFDVMVGGLTQRLTVR